MSDHEKTNVDEAQCPTHGTEDLHSASLDGEDAVSCCVEGCEWIVAIWR